MVARPSTVGLVALAVFDVPSKHIKLGRMWPDIGCWLSLYFMSIVVECPFETACAHARLILRCKNEN